MHFKFSGRKENEVPFLNRRDKEMVFENTGYYARPENVKKKTLMEPIGIKDISLTLVVPKMVNDTF
jgi:hypothetical protein